MIEFDNNVVMIESPDELPHLPERITELFGDFETSSGDSRLDSLNPWKNCDIAGFAFTWDDHRRAYYLPVGHVYGSNLPRDVALRFIADIVNRSTVWVNHNVKYDAHVYARHVGALPRALRYECTVVQAKIIDSDRGYGRGTYGLDSLSIDWLKEDISRYEQAFEQYLLRNKDYGQIPSDVMAPYAGQDVITVRRLSRYCNANIHPDCVRVWETEKRLTEVLIRSEQRGILIDPQQLRIVELQTMHKMLLVEERLKQRVGRTFQPHVPNDCYEVLCQQYGLPVLKWTNIDDQGNMTEKSSPSFDKHTLALYLVHPDAPKDVVSDIIAYRKMNTLLSLFVRPYQELHVDGVLRPNHNQCVRTGRLSCNDPNSQQCNEAAKELFHPRPGMSFLSCDASQIEYRTAASILRNKRVLDAYARDPDVDFHQSVADMCQIKRKPAKTVNFMIMYGGGKKKTVATLSVNEDVISDLQQRVEQAVASGEISPDERASELARLCKQRGLQVYERYHNELPEIRTVSRDMERVCKRRGYIKNLYGRHRHLPADHAHKAFNTWNQASAADIVKDRTVELDAAYENTGCFVMLNVHDEILSEVPTEVLRDPQFVADAFDILERPSVYLRVPIRWSAGASDKSWAKAKSDVGAPSRIDVQRSSRYEPGRVLFASLGGSYALPELPAAPGN